MTEVKWGFVFAGVTLLWMVLERAAGLHGSRIELHPLLTNLFAIPAIAVYVFALRDKRDRDLGGKMTYREGLIAGLVVTLVVTALAPLTQWITHAVVSPGFFPTVIAHSVAEGKMEPAAAEAYFSLGNYLRLGAIGALAMGIVTSAIVAFFVRTKPGE